jgi:hypothetical protein
MGGMVEAVSGVSQSGAAMTGNRVHRSKVGSSCAAALTIHEHLLLRQHLLRRPIPVPLPLGMIPERQISLFACCSGRFDVGYVHDGQCGFLERVIGLRPDKGI